LITEDQVVSIAKDLLRTAMLNPTADVQAALDETRNREQGRAREMYDLYFSVKDKLVGDGKMVCPDTGNLTFFIAIGSEAQIDPKLDWWRALYKATEELTVADDFYWPLIVDPVTHENFGTNCGLHMPYLRFAVVPGADFVELTASPKGGGAEPYTDFEILMPTDGVAGIRKFVLDCAVKGLSSGKTCPPNIVGVGIGGDAAISADLAMQACVMRPVGSRHPITWVAELEEQLRDDINDLGIGPMGSLGDVSVYDVHIEYAFGHMILVPVTFNIQCFIAHRASARIDSAGEAEPIDAPDLWFAGARHGLDYYREHSKFSGGLQDLDSRPARRFVTVAQAADELGISKVEVRKRAQLGQLESRLDERGRRLVAPS
jgi:tartrate/fumarate subfamily iron-sulfur-dependent hydro-lyase alpha chain